MNAHQLPARERVLSAWVKDRLTERDTIHWGVSTLRTIRGPLGEDNAALFRFLDQHAQSSDIDPTFMSIWRLYRRVADDSLSSSSLLPFEIELKRKIAQARFRLEDVDDLINWIRPRLKVSPLSRIAEATDSDPPIHWVSWSFETALSSMSLSALAFRKQGLSSLSDHLLSAILEKGTSALRDALTLCVDVRWITKEFDRPNYSVHRVFEADETSETDEDDDDRDPDAHNDDFAPLVRLLGLALPALAVKNEQLAKRVVSSWFDLSALSGLFLRLGAFGAWNSQLRSGREVGAFLLELPNHPFWRWSTFPEIATLRATRWNDLEDDVQVKLSERLLDGPDAAAFGREVDEATVSYHRDHEIARLVDSNAQVDEQLHRLVQARREVDQEFPPLVPKIELGLSGMRVTSISPGKPEKFDDVPTESLLLALAESQKTRGFADSDHTEAFARTLNGKTRILEALSTIQPSDPLFARSLSLLLSFPHETQEDALAEKEIAQRIVNLALDISLEEIDGITSQLCYWLDAIDAKVPLLSGTETLYIKLIPAAEKLANQKDDPQHYSSENDLTSAALNEPLGHLISFVFRRCPPIKGQQEAQLPAHLFAPFVRLQGRARELLANRVTTTMNYFVVADETLLNAIVIGPMMKNDSESNRLWEAFARYSPVPTPQLWIALQDALLKRMYSTDLTPDARRRISEMCVIVWISAQNGREYSLEATSLRSALTLANDNARAAAAWQFASVFRARNAEVGEGSSLAQRWKKLGRRFFDEVWPLEPALQSPASANDFARIPASVGGSYFADALNTIAPFLVPFQVWSIRTEFRLEPSESTTKFILEHFAEELLALLSLSIDEDQGHTVYDLGQLLDQMLDLHPELRSDYRIQRLRKMSLSLA